MGNQRVIASGSDLMVFISATQGGSYLPIANQKKLSLTFEPSDREVSSKNAGDWKNFAAGMKAWSLTVESDLSDPSDVDATEIDFEALQDYALARTKIWVKVAFISAPVASPAVIDTSKRIWSGEAMVNFPVEASHGENMATTYTFQGCGELDASTT